MPEHRPPVAQTLYRVLVMGGTLAIGSMAAYLYGPPVEKLAGYFKQAAHCASHYLAEQLEHRNSAKTLSTKSASLESVDNLPADSELLATTPAWLDRPQSSFVKQVSENDPALLLRRAGATEASIEPWGRADQTTGKTLFRAAATLPVSTESVGMGFVKRLDAIAETPELAAQAVLAQITSSNGRNLAR